MTHAITHDDFKRGVKTLESAGFESAQSEAIVEVVAQVSDTKLSEIATKQDLQSLKQELTIRFGVMLGAAVGILSAVIGIVAVIIKG